MKDYTFIRPGIAVTISAVTLALALVIGLWLIFSLNEAAQTVARTGRNRCGNRRRERRAREHKEHNRRSGRESQLTQMPAHKLARKADGGAPVNLPGKRLP